MSARQLCPCRMQPGLSAPDDKHTDHCNAIRDKLSTLDYDIDAVVAFSKKHAVNVYSVLDMIYDGVLAKDLKFQHDLDLTSALAAYAVIYASSDHFIIGQP